MPGACAPLTRSRRVERQPAARRRTSGSACEMAPNAGHRRPRRDCHSTAVLHRAPQRRLPNLTLRARRDRLSGVLHDCTVEAFAYPRSTRAHRFSISSRTTSGAWTGAARTTRSPRSARSRAAPPSPRDHPHRCGEPPGSDPATARRCAGARHAGGGRGHSCAWEVVRSHWRTCSLPLRSSRRRLPAAAAGRVRGEKSHDGRQVPERGSAQLDGRGGQRDGRQRWSHASSLQYGALQDRRASESLTGATRTRSERHDAVRMRGSPPVFLARRLVALAATVVVAPTLA